LGVNASAPLDVVLAAVELVAVVAAAATVAVPEAAEAVVVRVVAEVSAEVDEPAVDELAELPLVALELALVEDDELAEPVDDAEELLLLELEVSLLLDVPLDVMLWKLPVKSP
jgi:hypothetical protein